MVGIRVYDRREQQLPDVGILELKDAETGEKVWVDTASRAVRDAYARNWEQTSALIDSSLKRCRDRPTWRSRREKTYVTSLMKLFKRR